MIFKLFIGDNGEAKNPTATEATTTLFIVIFFIFLSHHPLYCQLVTCYNLSCKVFKPIVSEHQIDKKTHLYSKKVGV